MSKRSDCIEETWRNTEKMMFRVLGGDRLRLGWFKLLLSTDTVQRRDKQEKILSLPSNSTLSLSLYALWIKATKQWHPQENNVTCIRYSLGLIFFLQAAKPGWSWMSICSADKLTQTFWATMWLLMRWKYSVTAYMRGLIHEHKLRH